MVRQSDLSIEKIIRPYQIKPQKLRGQNFLINQAVVKRIIESAELKPTDVVLEIGPGLGILTKALVAKASLVWAVEIDKKLVSILNKIFASKSNIKIIFGDILKKSSEIIKSLPKNYKIVASLPFQITSRFLRIFLEANNQPTSLTLLVQKELGERICAKAGQMSLVSILVQFYGKPQVIQSVKKENFWPQPEVDAVILKIADVGKGYSLNYSTAQIKKFWQVARIGFSRRRKQLHNNLATGLGLKSNEIKGLLLAIGLDSRCRAQELTLEQWLEIVEKLRQ